jgi:phosphate transport system permease protein
MNVSVRGWLDRFFTVLTGFSIVLLTLVLIAVLGPMVCRGGSAVLFTGTIEFRKMQRDVFNRSDMKSLEADIARTEGVRRNIYQMVDDFKKGFDKESLTEEVRSVYRDFGQELRQKNIPSAQYEDLRQRSRDIREKLEEAFASRDANAVKADLAWVLEKENDPAFQNTRAAGFFKIARTYLGSVQGVDLGKQQEYMDSLREVELILFGSDSQPGLLGPRPGEPARPMVKERYGATRWEQARQLLDQFLTVEQWVQESPGRPMVVVRKSRAEQFPESMRPLFAYVETHAAEMLDPHFTFYWQFFFDDNVDGHYFGGVGPEVLGTLLITLLSMLFVVPLGVISAAYMVECASDNQVMRIIRMAINTLAGVPSIVFGLFGLAFFVTFLFPLLGFQPKECILAASMTLAVLTLPVMIRATEEAIRAVPPSYKEGSLALGAGPFHTFVTITLPAALPGILTGIILSLSRVAGETAPVLFTGAKWIAPVPNSIFDVTRTLSYGSYGIATLDRVAMLAPYNQYGMVVTLIGLILILNAMAIILRARVFKKLRGL